MNTNRFIGYYLCLFRMGFEIVAVRPECLRERSSDMADGGTTIR